MVDPLDGHGESALTPITPRRSSRRPKFLRRPDTTTDIFGSDESDSDTTDPDYTPVSHKLPLPKPAYKTPNNHVSDRDYYPLPDAVKRHVATASDLGGRCAIEWCMPESGVDYCHVIALSTTGDVLDKLEYSWGMQRFTFNLDTRYNIFILSQKCHRLFDNDQFVLIPSDSDIKDLKNHKRGQPLPHFDNVKYEYTLLPRKSMQRVAFLRLNNLPNDNCAITSADHTILTYPFSNLTITSHVRPEYVIYNAGKKISRHTLELAERYPEYNAAFLHILGIYNSWMGDAPSEFLEQEQSKTNTSASSHTNPRRRKNLWDNDSSTPSSKRRKTRGRSGKTQGGGEKAQGGSGMMNRSARLTYRSLQKLDNVDWKRKMSSVCGWREQVELRN